ncbi:flavodoxin [Methanomassiliicoccus luminyensis]|uniref:flavodoxin n=1 Tax=Methanomassiliicoccus luminyensis TaxID=1080712 RepID=UPI00036447D9|nr:flavodoxin [Methanomassiliicoccus luminyensis]
MSKVAIVYWSGTGNTEAMASLVAEGAKSAGAEVEVYQAKDFAPGTAERYTKIAFGCPAMGDEMLEEDEFEPMFASVEPTLKGKSVALFGSYDWGDGEWMRRWEERCASTGANIVAVTMAHEAPDKDAEAACKAMGAELARAGTSQVPGG